MGIYIWPDGTRYDGFWKNGKRDGLGRYVYANGNVYEGNWF